MKKTQTATPAPAPRGGRPTPLYLLAEARLGRSPIDLIVARRAEDPPVAYWKIAAEINKETELSVTLEAVRRWHHWHLAAVHA